MLWTSCIGATRLPARSHGPEGANIQKGALDLTFLQAGTTRRSDVIEKLQPIDTQYANPRLFWGRWSDSKWGYWWFVAGGYQAAGDAKRIWHVHNLLVTFDEKGVVQEQKIIDSDRDLWRELHLRLANSPAADWSQPLLINLGNSDPLQITFGKDTIHVERRKAKKSFDISPLKVVRFQHQRYETRESAPGMTCHALRLNEKTSLGKTISLCASPADVADLFQYLQDNGPKNMAWE